MNAVRLFAGLFSGYLAGQTIMSWRWQLNYFRISRPIEDPGRLLAVWTLPRLTEGQFSAARVALVAGCALGAAGTRVGFALAATACLAYFSQIRLLDSVQRKANLLPQVFALLALAPASVAAWNTGGDEWPLVAIEVLLALVYVNAGVAKLRRAGLRWADGRALQAYLLAADLRYDVPRARALAAHLPLCTVLSGCVLAFELLGWLLLLAPGGGYLFAILGLSMHTGTLVFMRVNYLKYHGAVYLVFAAHPLATVGRSLAGMP